MKNVLRVHVYLGPGMHLYGQGGLPSVDMTVWGETKSLDICMVFEPAEETILALPPS